MSEMFDNKLSRQLIKNGLDNDYEIEILSVTDSTNTYLKELAKKDNNLNKYVVLAEHQTAGRGRLGRSFLSPDGEGLYMSILCRPELSFENTALLTVATAVAVSDAIEKLTKCKTSIKWVNDIFINSKKACGILAESGMDYNTKRISYAVVGIGINVNMKEVPDEIKDIATSLEIECGKKLSRNTLAAEIINNFDKYSDNLTDRKYIEKYKNKSIVIGKTVTVIDPNGNYNATVTDIDDNGCLIIKRGNEIRILNSGEISIRL